MTLNERISKFLRIPEVADWHKAVDLKPKTKAEYTLRLMQILDHMKITPVQYLNDCDKNRKQLLGAVNAANYGSKSTKRNWNRSG